MTVLRRSKAIMVQGTGSHVGKSVLVAALCRIFHKRGFRVAPFKSQNMALNSFVTADGKEIGRAQALQARAAGVAPEAEMNPVLLKPSGPKGSQVILNGRPVGMMNAREYYGYRKEAFRVVEEAYRRLADRYDVMVIEGAGSPAEVNLKDVDIANMAVARMAQAAVILVGDIDRGGVFAWLKGTLDLLPEEDRSRVRGLVINKFRGDRTILEPGERWLEQATGLPVLGVLPYWDDLHLEEEDSLGLERNVQWKGGDEGDPLDVLVIRLPHISNYTDFLMLEQEPGVRLRYGADPALWGDPDWVILPGSKSTIEDLRFLKQRGFDRKIRRHLSLGRPLAGICSGYQMLGREICDPNGCESSMAREDGLGLLPLRTRFAPEKVTRQVTGRVVSPVWGYPPGLTFRGYEIHMGEVCCEGAVDRPFVCERADGSSFPEGAVGSDGLVLGTSVHGLFDEPPLREAVLAYVRGKVGKSRPSGPNPPSRSLDDHLGRQLDLLAERVEARLDVGRISSWVGVECG
jgi:adenosylcobyric acid synthase